MADLRCHCGRDAEKIHCPLCGSTKRYGYAKRKDTVTREDGSHVILRVFRCEACSHIYNDDDWQLRCNAPWLRAVARVVHTEKPASNVVASSNAKVQRDAEIMMRDPKVQEYLEKKRKEYGVE